MKKGRGELTPGLIKNDIDYHERRISYHQGKIDEAKAKAGATQVVIWPDSQVLMEQEWFDRCTLINDELGIKLFGKQAYEVPSKLYNKL